MTLTISGVDLCTCVPPGGLITSYYQFSYESGESLNDVFSVPAVVDQGWVGDGPLMALDQYSNADCTTQIGSTLHNLPTTIQVICSDSFYTVAVWWHIATGIDVYLFLSNPTPIGDPAVNILTCENSNHTTGGTATIA